MSVRWLMAQGVRWWASVQRESRSQPGAVQPPSRFSIARREDGLYGAAVDGTTLIASHLVLATGVVDLEPPLPNVIDAVRRGLVRQCPICDAYEAIDRKLAVIGRMSHRPVV